LLFFHTLSSILIVLSRAPEIIETWEEDKKRQVEGKSKTLNLEAFLEAVEDLENAQRERRKLRRLKYKINSVLSAIGN